MQIKKNVMRLLVFAVCAALASGCAMQATTGGEDQAAKMDSGQTTTPSSTGSSAGSTGGVSDSGFSAQAVVDTGASGSVSDTGAQVASLMRVHFDFDRYELKEEARMILTGNAAYLKANPTAKIRIEGHCDERGSDEYNLALGEQRAMAAKRYLQSLGVDTSRLTIISYGEEKPLDSRKNEAAWSKNRRAEFVSR